jgi:hypothetical protein
VSIHTAPTGPQDRTRPGRDSTGSPCAQHQPHGTSRPAVLRSLGDRNGVELAGLRRSPDTPSPGPARGPSGQSSSSARMAAPAVTLLSSVAEGDPQLAFVETITPSANSGQELPQRGLKPPSCFAQGSEARWRNGERVASGGHGRGFGAEAPATQSGRRDSDRGYPSHIVGPTMPPWIPLDSMKS